MQHPVSEILFQNVPSVRWIRLWLQAGSGTWRSPPRCPRVYLAAPPSPAPATLPKPRPRTTSCSLTPARATSGSGRGGRLPREPCQKAPFLYLRTALSPTFRPSPTETPPSCYHHWRAP